MVDNSLTLLWERLFPEDNYGNEYSLEIIMGKPILCRLGLHKWGKERFTDPSFQSNVLEYTKKCERCGEKKKWVGAKKH
jgi:hypothetical protein